jgi:hypothetical protein
VQSRKAAQATHRSVTRAQKTHHPGGAGRARGARPGRRHRRRLWPGPLLVAHQPTRPGPAGRPGGGAVTARGGRAHRAATARPRGARPLDGGTARSPGAARQAPRGPDRRGAARAPRGPSWGRVARSSSGERHRRGTAPSERAGVSRYPTRRPRAAPSHIDPATGRLRRSGSRPRPGAGRFLPPPLPELKLE